MHLLGASHDAVTRPNALMLAAMLVPLAARCVIPLFHTLARTCAKASRSLPPASLFARSSSLLGADVHGRRAPEVDVFEVVPGLVLGFKRRAARHAVRPGRLARSGSSIRSIRSATCAATTSRARPRSTSASPSPSPRTHGRRLSRQPVHAVPVLRSADALDLSAGHPQAEPTRRKPAGRIYLLMLLGTSMVLAAAGDHPRPGRRRHARVHAGRHSRRQGRAAAMARAAGAVRLRHRQGRA